MLLPPGHDANMRYFTSTRLALAPVDEKNLFKAIPNQLVITVRPSCCPLDLVIKAN